MELEQSVCKLKEYIDALEDERRKIEVFQRELPLCMQLVAIAIEGCKKQMIVAGSGDARSDWEVTSNEGPVLEEFIPLKRSSSSEVEDGERPDEYHGANESIAGIEKSADWLKSVQLWAHDNDQTSSKQEGRSIIEPNKSNGAFHPFCREDMEGIKPAAPTATTASSSAENGGRASNEKTGRAERKTRRCWSPELHRRFLHALELLGGSRAATPKQIKELMKVDGLTNDEVKSHLQKYRLNNRRPSQSVQCQSVGDAQLPQFVVVGGIWVPPAEHPHVMAGEQRTKVYTPTPRFPNGRRGEVEANSRGSGGGTSSGDSLATSTSSRVWDSLPGA